MSLSKLFLHERTVEVILRILEAEEKNEKIYPLQISNDLGSPYSYVSKVLGDFEKNSLLESEVEGRIRVVRLTEFGRKIARMLRELKNELNKDFNARKKLKILSKLAREGGDFRTLAPVLAELEALKESTNDSEVIEEVEKTRKIVEAMIE